MKAVLIWSVAVAVAVLVVIAYTSTNEASAHTNGPNPDENGNGKLEVYVSSNYHGGWETYRDRANSLLRNDAPSVPRIRMVDSKEQAELWVHKSFEDWPNSHCAGTSKENPGGLDEVITDSSCPDPPTKLIGHEVGHIYSLPDGPVDGPPEDAHHECTEYWQNRTVNVGETSGDGIDGCKVLILAFGPHDLRALEAKYSREAS